MNNILLLFIASFVAIFASIMIGIPVAFGLGLVGILLIGIVGGGMDAIQAIGPTAFYSISDFILIAVPLFVLLGEILQQSGLATDLFNVVSQRLRRVPGVLGIATLFGSGVFAALSGSSIATAAAMGKSSLPEMRRHNYDVGLSVGCIATGGTFGIMVPPSIPLIIYGAQTQESVGKLFMAGIVPGLVDIIIPTIYILIIAKWRPSIAPPIAIYSKEDFVPWSKMLPYLTIIVAILGSIYTGICTPSESAGIGVLISLLLMWSQRRLGLRDTVNVMRRTAITTTMIFMIIIGATIFGYTMSLLKIPQTLCSMIVESGLSRWQVMIAINLTLLFLGCFMEVISIMVITLPLLYPIVTSLGFDPIWFAIIFVVNMETGLITPPVGMNLYVLKGIAPDISFFTIFRGVIPFVFLTLIGLVILMAFPQLSLWIPNHMF